MPKRNRSPHRWCRAVLVLALAAGTCVRGQEAGLGEDPEISRRLVQALKTDDPDARLQIYDEILKLDPGNTDARNGYKEAKVASAQKHAAEAEITKKEREKLETDARGRTALRLARQLLYAGNFAGARNALNEAERLGQAGPEVLSLDRLISRAQWNGNFRRSLGLGAFGVALVGTFAWIASLFHRRRPYVELLNGAARGRRYPMEKDVLTIGAVAQKGEEKNDVVVSDPEKTISRFHCEIHRKGRRYYVVDCHSSNGTWVDGHPIPPGRLVPISRGARIQLGASCSLKFGLERRKS